MTGARDVGDVRFRATFSLAVPAVPAGLAFAHPVNVWLVANHLKHGMGTVRALGEDGEPLPTAAPAHAGASGMAAAMAMPEAEVTAEQKTAMAVLTVLFLAAGVLLAAIFGHLA
ncbi:hypothetical protein ACIOG8_25810 [Streptomyces erythrochromogenes]|uniref:hypothetical protein n=1 Tax=Streptomyces erythrochromogenes TaxID=285574 RepID=UPI00381DF46A